MAWTFKGWRGEAQHRRRRAPGLGGLVKRATLLIALAALIVFALSAGAGGALARGSSLPTMIVAAPCQAEEGAETYPAAGSIAGTTWRGQWNTVGVRPIHFYADGIAKYTVNNGETWQGSMPWRQSGASVEWSWGSTDFRATITGDVMEGVRYNSTGAQISTFRLVRE